jgi:antitoxin YefM
MSIEISYSEARNNLASILDQVTDDCEVVTIKRRGHKDVALISADELSSMLETDYLFRSPNNAKRLLKAFESVKAGRGKKMTVDELRKEFGAEKTKRK